MTALKLCGITLARDAEHFVGCVEGLRGPAFVGCVVATDSPRRASAAQVRDVVSAAAGSGVEPVLVTRATTLAACLRVADATGVRRVQWHGAAARDLEQLGAAGLLVHPVVAVEPTATALPAYTADEREPTVLDVGRGGSGRTFDWGLLGARGPRGVFVAGGLTPDNLPRLLRRHRPWGIDLSSGVERAPGVKDPGMVTRVVDCVRGHDAALRPERTGDPR